MKSNMSSIASSQYRNFLQKATFVRDSIWLEMDILPHSFESGTQQPHRSNIDGRAGKKGNQSSPLIPLSQFLCRPLPASKKRLLKEAFRKECNLQNQLRRAMGGRPLSRNQADIAMQHFLAVLELGF